MNIKTYNKMDEIKFRKTCVRWYTNTRKKRKVPYWKNHSVSGWRAWELFSMHEKRGLRSLMQANRINIKESEYKFTKWNYKVWFHGFTLNERSKHNHSFDTQ